MKKTVLFTILLLTSLGGALAQSEIIFFRESNAIGAAISYDVFVNDEMVVKLRNNTFHKYSCAPGTYKIRIEKGNEYTLDVIEGETCYMGFVLKTGFWKATPQLMQADNDYAEQNVSFVSMHELKDSEDMPRHNPSRIGLRMFVGFGLKNIPSIELDNGSMANYSFGGGFGAGLNYGREIGRFFDISFDMFYVSSGLTPSVSNAKMNFSRIGTRLTPALIIPIDGGYSMRIKLGAGAGYYFNSSMKLELSELPGGFNDKYDYSSAYGPHFQFVFEMNPFDEFLISYGLSYYKLKYDFIESQNGSFPTDPDFIEGDGSGIDLTIGVFYNF